MEKDAAQMFFEELVEFIKAETGMTVPELSAAARLRYKSVNSSLNKEECSIGFRSVYALASLLGDAGRAFQETSRRIARKADQENRELLLELVKADVATKAGKTKDNVALAMQSIAAALGEEGVSFLQVEVERISKTPRK